MTDLWILAAIGFLALAFAAALRGYFLPAADSLLLSGWYLWAAHDLYRRGERR